MLVLKTALSDGVRQPPTWVAGRANQYLSPIDVPPGLPHSCVAEPVQGRSPIQRSLVVVVDDDESVRESLPDLLKEFGFVVHAYSSAEEFLASDSIGQTKCLVLDIAMPGMNGLGLQRELKARGQKIPIVFITGRRDEAVQTQALQEGAVEVLLKPFSDTALLAALNKAVRID
jgi:FixJ family two-component response regulator